MEPQFPDNNHFNAIPAPQPVAPHQHAQTNIPVSAFYTPNNPPAPVGPPQTHTHTQALNATQLPPQHHPHVQAQAQVQARQSFGTEQGQGQGQMARSVEMGVATGMGMGMGMGAEGQRQRQTHGQLSGSMGSGGRHSGQSGMGGVSGVTGDGGGGDGGVDFFSDGSHNAFAKMGLSLGKNLVSKKVGGVFAFIQAQRLKTYFAVNNDYVLRKLKILLMPLSHKNYLRKKRNSHSMHGMSSQMQGDSADEGMSACVCMCV